MSRSTKREEIVRTCLQCQEDVILGMRENSHEAIEVMSLLSDEYHQGGRMHKDGTKLSDYAHALIETEKDHRRLRAMIRADAERLCRDVDELVAALKFIAVACRHHSSGVHVGSDEITIGISDLLHTAIDKLQSIVMSSRGLLQGKQPQNDRDFMTKLWKQP